METSRDEPLLPTESVNASRPRKLSVDKEVWIVRSAYVLDEEQPESRINALRSSADCSDGEMELPDVSRSETPQSDGFPNDQIVPVLACHFTISRTSCLARLVWGTDLLMAARALY